MNDGFSYSTDAQLRTFTFPTDLNQPFIELRDARISGLSVRVQRSGTATFYVRARLEGVQKRLKLGRYPDLALAEARRKARSLLAAQHEGRRWSDVTPAKGGAWDDSRSPLEPVRKGQGRCNCIQHNALLPKYIQNTRSGHARIKARRKSQPPRVTRIDFQSRI